MQDVCLSLVCYASHKRKFFRLCLNTYGTATGTFKKSCFLGLWDECQKVSHPIHTIFNVTCDEVPTGTIFSISFLTALQHVFPSFLCESQVSTPLIQTAVNLCTMALRSNTFTVYVALQITLLFFLNNASISAGSGLSSESLSGLLPPYDELYYRGVRAYFNEEWERAAEFIEKSISTREMLLKTRLNCHDECLTAGDDRLSKLGYCLLFVQLHRVFMHHHLCVFVCVSTPK